MRLVTGGCYSGGVVQSGGADHPTLSERWEPMRRILLVLAVGAIMVLSSVSYAFAYANPNNNGKAEEAPGQVNADRNCGNVVEKQEAKGVEAGGGPKAGDDDEAPVNCDHFWQE
jgi:hypothetical protein